MKYEIHPDLDKILSKLSKKDKSQYEQILKKINEIINSGDINHYKNLKGPLQNYKRVHIGHFVLLFKVEGEIIIFRYYDHHDNIYRGILLSKDRISLNYSFLLFFFPLSSFISFNLLKE